MNCEVGDNVCRRDWADTEVPVGMLAVPLDRAEVPWAGWDWGLCPPAGIRTSRLNCWYLLENKAARLLCHTFSIYLLH